MDPSLLGIECMSLLSVPANSQVTENAWALEPVSQRDPTLQRASVPRLGGSRNAKLVSATHMSTVAHALILECIRLEGRSWPDLVRFCAAFRRAHSMYLEGKDRLFLIQYIAEELLVQARFRNLDSVRFRRSLTRTRKLGYSSLSRRVLCACVVAQWAVRRRSHHELAFRELNDARRRVMLLRRANPLRRNLLQLLDENSGRIAKVASRHPLGDHGS